MTWRNRQGAVAALTIVAAMVWRAVLLADSFFNQDDYFLSARAYGSDLDARFLVEPNAGHVNPLQQLTYWLVSHSAPFSWPVVATFILAMHVIGAVLMWHVLSRLLPDRWVRIPLLVAFVCSPLTLVTSLWWSASMGLWPHLIFSLWSILFLLRAHQHVGRRWVNLLGCVLTTGLGLLWHERAVLIVPTLLGIAVVLADDKRGWRRITGAVRTYWPLWATYATLLVAYLIGHSAITSVEGGSAEVGEGVKISASFVGENVVPGLLSGPWSADLRGGAVLPAPWVTVLACVAAVGLVILLVRRGGPSAGWAMAGLAGYVLADLALLLSGRSGFGRVIGLDPRYSSDVAHAAVVCVALALRGSPARFGMHFQADRSWRRARTVGVAAVTAVYVVGAAFATAQLVPHFQNPEDRRYVTNLRADLAADPNRVIVDAAVPGEIVLPLLEDEALLSRVFASLPESPAFDQPSARLRVVDDEGRLRPVGLGGAIEARPGPLDECGYAVRSGSTDVELLVPIKTPVVVRVAYYTDVETTVDVTAGSTSTQFQARPGPNEVWIPVPERGRQLETVRFSGTGATTVCVTDLEAGLPFPRED